MSLLTLFRSAAPRRSRASGCRCCSRMSALVTGKSDLVATLQEEILAVIAKHVTVDRDKVQIKLDRGATVSMLEIDIEVPAFAALKAANG